MYMAIQIYFYCKYMLKRKQFMYFSCQKFWWFKKK